MKKTRIILILIVILFVGDWLLGQPIGGSFLAVLVHLTDNDSTNENNVIIFAADADSDGGPVRVESDSDLYYNPSTGTLTAKIFSGTVTTNANLIGEVTSVGNLATITDSVTVTGWVLGTSSATQLTSPTLITDLIDTTGAADIDYGSADVTDHTFTADGGVVIIDGSVTAATSFIIGSADMSETDLEQLDGITPGTAAASKALVLDGSLDIATINSLTATTLVGALTGNASTATALANPRDIGGVSFDGSANIVPTTIVVADTEDATTFVGLWTDATGNLLPKTDEQLTYVANTGVLTAVGLTSTADITSGDNFIASLGAEGTPSYTFTGDLTTGMWSPAASTIAWSLGGSEAMRLDSSALTISTGGLVVNSTEDIGLDMSGGTFSQATQNWPADPEIQAAGTLAICLDATNFNVLLGTGDVADRGIKNVFIGFEAGQFNDSSGTSPRGTQNVYIGYHAGNSTVFQDNDGYRNLAIGEQSLRSNTTGFNCFALGYLSMFSNTSGQDDVALGVRALEKNTNGFFNIGLGSSANRYNETGDENITIGVNSGGGAKGSVASHDKNVIIGSQSAPILSTGSSDIFLGYKSGFNQTTLSNLLIIDNQDRGSAAAEITDCLMYGVFSATPASQTIRFNVGDLITGNPVHSDADGGGAMVHSFIREDGAGTASTAATITVSHDGAGVNDQLAKMVLGINTGAGVVDALSINSDIRVAINTTTGLDTRAGLTVTGDIDILHTATEPDDHAFQIDVDAATLGDVKAIDIVYTTGILVAGRDEGIILINIDETVATGGDVFGLEVLSTDGSAEIYGMKVGAVVNPIHQDSGVFINPITATDNTTGPADVAAMKDGDLGTTTAIFEALDEYILIGGSAVFEEMEFILTTGSSGPGIKPTFLYSTAGSHQFTPFTPVDGTNAFRNTGLVAWDASDLTSHGINTDTGTYDIKIIRTRNSLSTSPVLGYAKTAATTEYIWDKSGDVNINSLTLATDLAIADGGTGQGTAQAAIDALTDVAGGTNEHVLTKDTGTGNAIWKVTTATGGDEKVGVDAAATSGYLGVASGDGVLRTGTGLTYTDGGDFVTLAVSGAYVDRGDPATNDYGVGDLTTNGTWVDLDLSGIVPAGAKAVNLKLFVVDDAVSSTLQIRKNGNSNEVAGLAVSTQVSGVGIFGFGSISCDTNRVVEYNAANTTWTTIFITVLGWWI